MTGAIKDLFTKKFMAGDAVGDGLKNAKKNANQSDKTRKTKQQPDKKPADAT